jgi:H+/gluconate symporter-like permease
MAILRSLVAIPFNPPLMCHSVALQLAAAAAAAVAAAAAAAAAVLPLPLLLFYDFCYHDNNCFH